MPASQEFYRRVAERRQDQVDRASQALASQAGLFERRIELTAPGDVNVDPSKMLVLSGTGTTWDQQYYIQSVTFTFDQPQEMSDYGGCTMIIDAANMAGDKQDSAPGPLPAIASDQINTFGATGGTLDVPNEFSPSVTPGAADGFKQ